MIFLIAWTLRYLTQNLALGTEVLKFGPQFCQHWLPRGRFIELDAALLCGVDLPASGVRQALLDTGLIHIMVVSGSHLAFLETLLASWPALNRLVTPILVSYCFLVGFEPPVVRALIRRFLDQPLKRHYAVTSLQLEAATIFLALLIYPPWITSRSFLMSWMCGLALSSPKLGWRSQSLELSVKCYFFLLPFCWSSPLTILWNTLLAPLVGTSLFPARLLTYFFHFLAPLTNWLWSGFIFLIQNGPQSVQLDMFTRASTLTFVPVIVHLALLILEVRWRRGLAFA
jgi:hypothetical protein